MTSNAAGPSERQVDILIIGAGFSGIVMALELRRRGFQDIAILEKGADFGGTWRENTYPGVACDIPSHLYSLAGHPNPGWRRRYAGGAEIQGYLRQVAGREGLDRITHFGCTFAGATWVDGRWRVETEAGQPWSARVVIPAMGPLHVPLWPDIPGFDAFTGACIHSAQWDPGVTLAGRDVAVIGSGASAGQLVPRIARQARRLTVYLRSPPWVLPHFDFPLPRWMRWLYRALPVLRHADRAATFQVQEMKHRVFRGDRTISALVTCIARAHMRWGYGAALMGRLAPDYHIGCKRILLSNAWCKSLARPNVEVVIGQVRGASTHGITGADGITRPADAVILATGFRAAETLSAMPFTGRDGQSLTDLWADGVEAYLGSAVSGFPNLFCVLGPNTALGHNSVVLMAEAQAEHIARVLAEMRAEGVEAVEPREERQASHGDEVRKALVSTVWQTGGCTSWYKDEKGRNPMIWPGTVRQFRRLTRVAGLEDYRPV